MLSFLHICWWICIYVLFATLCRRFFFLSCSVPFHLHKKGIHYFGILFPELILKENGELSTNRALEINNLWDILACFRAPTLCTTTVQFIQDFANKQIYSVNQWEGCPQSWVKLQNQWAIKRNLKRTETFLSAWRLTTCSIRIWHVFKENFILPHCCFLWMYCRWYILLNLSLTTTLSREFV